jgi:hypothetical protein
MTNEIYSGKKLTMPWSDVMKWLVLIIGIATTYTVMQVKIAALEIGRSENRTRIDLLETRVQDQESQIASMNAKLTNIGDDVTTIKNAVLTRTFGSAWHE